MEIASRAREAARAAAEVRAAAEREAVQLQEAAADAARRKLDEAERELAAALELGAAAQQDAEGLEAAAHERIERMRAAAQRDADALRVAAQTEVEALRAGAASLPGLRQKGDEELDDVQSSAVAAEEQAVIEDGRSCSEDWSIRRTGHECHRRSRGDVNTAGPGLARRPAVEPTRRCLAAVPRLRISTPWAQRGVLPA